MELIDSHCHLEPKDFTVDGPDGPRDERDDVIARARAAGVVGFICIGSGRSLDEVSNAVALAEAHDDLWAGIGIHPHDVARMPPGALDEIERLAAMHKKVVAVGETGLDYHYDHSPREAQRAALRAFVGIARRVKKPLSLHIRDAHDDALQILDEERAGEVGGVVHCFTGTRADAERYVALGLHVGAARAAAGGDRLPLPGPGPPARQAQRAGLRGAHRPRGGGAARGRPRGVRPGRHREHPPPVPPLTHARVDKARDWR
jgi:TatD DNase family protein